MSTFTIPASFTEAQSAFRRTPSVILAGAFGDAARAAHAGGEITDEQLANALHEVDLYFIARDCG